MGTKEAESASEAARGEDARGGDSKARSSSSTKEEPGEAVTEASSGCPSPRVHCRRWEGASAAVSGGRGARAGRGREGMKDEVGRGMGRGEELTVFSCWRREGEGASLLRGFQEGRREGGGRRRWVTEEEGGAWRVMKKALHAVEEAHAGVGSAGSGGAEWKKEKTSVQPSPGRSSVVGDDIAASRMGESGKERRLW